MRVLFDTSVLIACMVEDHPEHERALPWLRHARDGTDAGFVAAHSIAELYAVLTRLPIHPVISPVLAYHLIKENVLGSCEVISLSDQDYVHIVEHLAQLRITGGVIYDALILFAAMKARVERVLTLNEKDFRRIYPHLANLITSP